ncbi:MAG: cell division protein SepF [Clostridia bacterium]|nr:cell division protein SepF [Clostridia bacterium]
MSMFKKIGRWVADQSDRFVRGVAPREEENVGVVLQGQPEAAETGEGVRQDMVDPFGHGEDKYGGRTPYRSRADIEEEARQRAAQQQYEQQQQQYAQQQQQYAQQQQYVQQQQYEQQQQYAQQQQYEQQQQYAQQQQYEQQQQGQYTLPSNVVTMPGMQTGADGNVYAHMEYIVQLTDRGQCRKVIDYIRNNASVFLNMEAIEDPSERLRCVDVLSGASYALGCQIRRISPCGVYLISSPSVQLVLDEASKEIARAPEVRSFARQSYEPRTPSYAVQQTMPELPVENVRNGGFSSGSPTHRFQSQGAQAMPVSFGTAMTGSMSHIQNAMHGKRYGAQ